MVLGCWLANSSKAEKETLFEEQLPFMLMAVMAGSCLPIQAAINRVRGGFGFWDLGGLDPASRHKQQSIG